MIKIYSSLKKTLSLSLFPPPLASRRLAMQPTATGDRTWPPTSQLWLMSDQVRPSWLYVATCNQIRPSHVGVSHCTARSSGHGQIWLLASWSAKSDLCLGFYHVDLVGLIQFTLIRASLIIDQILSVFD